MTGVETGPAAGPAPWKEDSVRRYYGWNDKEHRVMLATVTGEMADGTKVYTECTGDRELINMDAQYIRTLRYGSVVFIRL